MKEIRIVVAAHKQYWVPKEKMYLPIQVGAVFANAETGFQRDDDGLNISFKNPRYCELTALYWVWKNLNAEYFGLVHYRRHFRGAGEKSVLTNHEAELLLHKAPVVLPKKRNYVIETISSHYSHTMSESQLAILREVIADLEPAYLSGFDTQMQRRSAHMFNMFIMRNDILNSYCSWLFPILASVEERIDFSGLSAFEARCIGRLSEMLLDVWISVNNIEYLEHAIISIEPVNWLNKGTSFLLAKIFNKKYKASF